MAKRCVAPPALPCTPQHIWQPPTRVPCPSALPWGGRRREGQSCRAGASLQPERTAGLGKQKVDFKGAGKIRAVCSGVEAARQGCCAAAWPYCRWLQGKITQGELSVVL